MILGVIADDFTGATDVASMLVRAGMRTIQVIGVPDSSGEALPEADAVVIALKSRTIAPSDAVSQSLRALDALRAAGARQIYFKYCSTFDSTPQGNIGPVTDALMAALGAGFTIACPAFPENGRTIYRGHLFVGDQLLSESGMQHHPLTPMTDANLVRVLQAQTRQPVDLLRYEAIARGVQSTRQRIDELASHGVRIAIADAVDNEDLLTLAEACVDMPLLTAGSGLALGLPAAYARRGWLTPDPQAQSLGAIEGTSAVLAGSCSRATNDQVQRWLSSGGAGIRLDPLALHRGEQSTEEIMQRVDDALANGPVLVYATATPEQVTAVQTALGTEAAGKLVEDTLATIARHMVSHGVRRLVVAGGETSGAVVQALGVRQLRIGASICPGVPWTEATHFHTGQTLQLALKSGNFGGPNFFREALA